MPNPPPRHLLCWPEFGIEMAFRLIPPGRFLMGSRGLTSGEEPRHWVEIEQSFWMAETPVTQAQFALWTQEREVEHQNHFEDKPTHPAENSNWRQAVGFCQWLTATQRGAFPEGFAYATLPTEAEWEYACRAGTESEYYSGDGEEALERVGWFDEDLLEGSSHPVAQKEPNDYQLYDMSGNVWEWVYDLWDGQRYRERRPDAIDREAEHRMADLADEMKGAVVSDELRVLRGGSWYFAAWICRSAYRNWCHPGGRYWCHGFRVCLVRDNGPSSP